MTTPPTLEPHSTDVAHPAPSKPRKWFKPRLDWLLVFVPVAIVLRFVPSLENPTALFHRIVPGNHSSSRLDGPSYRAPR
jgi:hypothetical protein